MGGVVFLDELDRKMVLLRSTTTKVGTKICSVNNWIDDGRGAIRICML